MITYVPLDENEVAMISTMFEKFWQQYNVDPAKLRRDHPKILLDARDTHAKIKRAKDFLSMVHPYVV